MGFSFFYEFYRAVFCRIERVVTTLLYVRAWVEFGAPLADEDFAGIDFCAIGSFDAKTFGF